MSLSNTAGEYVLDTGKLTPSIAATTVLSQGYSLADWVSILTILYTVLMIASLIYKFFNNRKSKDDT